MKISGPVMATSILFLSAATGVTAQEDIVRPAKVAQVQTSETVFTRRYPAIVQPSLEAVLSFRVSGRVIQLPIRASDFVKEGDIIAQLDPRDFERQIAQLETQRDQAAAQLSALRTGARTEEISALEAGIEGAQAQVNQASEQANRSRELFSKDLVAAVTLQADETALSVAEAQLRAKKEELTIARTGGRQEELDAAKAALKGLETQISIAQDNLNDATLRAPFGGIVARRDIENFTNIQAGQDVVLLQKLSDVDLVFDVPGPDVVFLASADPTSVVQLEGIKGELFDAELVEFSAKADAATQTYRGRVRVAVPRGTPILAGMVGNVITSVETGAAENLSVPLTAVGANTDGSSFVWIVDGSNIVTKSLVTLGAVLGDQVVITKGVTAKDTVVSAGVTQIRDKMVIRPITKVGG